MSTRRRKAGYRLRELVAGCGKRGFDARYSLRGFVAAPVAALLGIVAGCAPSADPTPPLAPEAVLSSHRVLISDADHDLALPADIAVDAEGNTYVMDRRARHVLVVAQDGTVERTIGRDGAGPGEFRVLLGIAVRNDRLYALDTVHGVQVFGLDGAHLDQYDAARIVRDFDFSYDGGLLFSNNRVYAGGALVGRLGPAGEALEPFGELVEPEAVGWDFGAIRAEILEGRLPAELRNHSLPVAEPGGSVYVVVQTEGILRRYGADGGLASAVVMPVRELDEIREQYFLDFASLPSLDGFFLPSHVADGAATDDDLFLLWKTLPGAPALVTVHRGGELVQRIVLPGLDTGGAPMSILRLAADEPRRRLLISVSDTATVYSAQLPEGVGF